MSATIHLLPSVQIVRFAEIPVDDGFFWHDGRCLIVRKTYGTDPAAPVIAEELEPNGQGLPGQYALWCVAAVRQHMNPARNLKA